MKERSGLVRGRRGRREGSQHPPPLPRPLSASPLQVPSNLSIQTYHKVLLREDLLLVEVLEPSGLLLQLLPQCSIALRGGRSEWHSAQAKTASANIPFTKLLNKIHCRAWKVLESEVGLRGGKLVDHIWVWGPT